MPVDLFPYQLLQRSVRAAARRLDEALRPLQLTNEQFSLLMELNGRRSSISALSARLAVDRTTLTASAKRLQRRQLVRISLSSSDQRKRTLLLTERGRDLTARASPIWEKTHEELGRLIAEPRLIQLRQILEQLSPKLQAREM